MPFKNTKTSNTTCTKYKFLKVSFQGWVKVCKYERVKSHEFCNPSIEGIGQWNPSGLTHYKQPPKPSLVIFLPRCAIHY